MIAPGSRPLNVKFILTALKEASDPHWRPIKYSLFPPLGLATVAAYLSPDDRATMWTNMCSCSRLATRQSWS